MLGLRISSLTRLQPSNINAVAIQYIKIENEGWERDVSVTEPAEPTDI